MGSIQYLSAEEPEGILGGDTWTEIDALKAVIDNLAEGVIVANQEGRFVVFNRVAESILGMGSVDAPPHEWTKTFGCFYPDSVTAVPPEDLPLARAMRGEEVADFEMIVRNPAVPEGVLIRANSRPLRDELGSLRGGVVWLRDITELKAAEERLERLSNAVEQTADSVLITDGQGVIEYVNPAFVRTTGYNREEVLGQKPNILKSGQHSEEFYEGLWTTISEGNVFRGTLVNRKKCGQLYWAEQTITPIKTEAGKISHYVSVLKDVTEQRRQQEQEFQIRLAREVQQRYYREAPFMLAGFDIAGAAFPAAETGGDYFDFLHMPDGCLGITIGDVTGHGFGSALIMAETRAYVRSFSQIESDVGKILTRVNRALAADLVDGRYVTLLLGILDPENRTFAYASAGHVAGYLLKGSGKLGHVLESTGKPLGLFADASFEASQSFHLESGDLLALLTDGVTEATSPDGREFGSDRLVDTLNSNRSCCAKGIIERIYEAACNFAGGPSPHDDITTVICRVAP